MNSNNDKVNNFQIVTTSVGGSKGRKVSLNLNKKHKKIEAPSTSHSEWDDAALTAAAAELFTEQRDIIAEVGFTREELVNSSPNIQEINNLYSNITPDIADIPCKQVDLDGINPLPLSQNAQVWDISQQSLESYNIDNISKKKIRPSEFMTHFLNIRKEHVKIAQNKHELVKSIGKNLKDKKVRQVLEGYLKVNENLYFALREERSLHEYLSLKY